MDDELTQELLWKIADGQASDDEIMTAFKLSLKIIKNQLKRRASLDAAEPLLNFDDLEQEAWLKFKGWCRSYPRDREMPPAKWIRVCWRNASINLSEYWERKRPRKWVSLNKMEDDQREQLGQPLDSAAPEHVNIDEIYRDLCLIIDKTPMDPRVKRRMKKFMAFRLNGYSVADSTKLVHYLTDQQGEAFRKAELLIIERYLGHKPLSR